MNIRLDVPERKISHISNDGKQKVLSKHIQEIMEVSSEILGKHLGDCEECQRIINILAAMHDVGKLNPEWNIYNKRNPPHSILSAYFYLESGDYDPLIFYLIWRHHGSLKAPQYSPGWIKTNFLRYLKHPDININKSMVVKIYRLVKDDLHRSTRDYYKNVLYSDLFGIFKTADILSAKFQVDLKVLKENLNFDEAIVKARFKEYVKSKGIKFNESKWKCWDNMAENSNILLLAPTGWGKTFASIRIALAHKPSHIIYILPTITAIRKMRESLKQLFEDIDIEENYFFADTEMISKESNNIDETLFTELFVAKSFMAPITITTLDQMLMSFLNVGKYHLKRYHFRNSFLIFDEYHLYPLSGLILLLKILTNFNNKFGYNMKFIFMSATEDVLYTSIIKKHISNIKEYRFLSEYKKLKRYNYKLLNVDILDEKIVKLIEEHFERRKILVIVNCVNKAIKMYLRLRSLPTNVILLHSRFTYEDRRKKENTLESLSKSDKPMILISTQVAEVSLDMSFDYLFTEIAPLTSLIQRFGRVNRYGVYTDNLNVFLATNTEDSCSPYGWDQKEIEKKIKLLKELSKIGIKNEYDLLDHILREQINEEEGLISQINLYFKKWEENTRYIYTVDLWDEDINKILKIRDTHTTLVIPRCLEKVALDILSSDNKIKNTLIKNLLVPVPLRWIGEERDKIHNLETTRIPVFESKKYLYSPTLGYYNSEKISSPSDVETCEDYVFLY
ncbi:DEAD/DEAH box helicase [Aciduliprofundum sp. MAR08-339]|uniref:CRISPR-associated helicase Cas3' n=1 Tax=Aciduliprofundum sp. (strain MAR08-339) TaxID=673860 RepID=UPI0002A498EC|nr:DEAD/DEAH box helicase [Aciduliprofundum sp. MAR08-339]